MLRATTRVAATAARVARGVRSMSAAPALDIKHTEAFINNEWVAGSEKFITENPATQEVLAEVTDCTATEVDMAVEAATNAFYTGAYSQLGGHERGMLLNKLADAIEANLEELAMLEVLDNGKTIGEATGADLALTIQCYRYYAGWADKIQGSVINPSGPFAKGLFAIMQQEPVGVVGQIIPWNFPLLMQAWKIGPAIATGCTTVIKTAPQTPLTALRVAALAKEVGFPEGAINILPGTDDAGKLLANHSGLDKLAFTGSTEVGRKIMHQAADSDKLARVTLELGGKSPMIVFDDADIDVAVGTAQVGVFLNQGQTCCATTRVFVQDDVYDEFVEKSVAATEARQVGPGWDANSAQGSQVSKEQADSIMRYIESGTADGAELVSGGNRHGDKGYFVEPTVFANVQDDMLIAREEIFGPVMSIMKFSEAEEAIARANANEYGLGASVFSKDFHKVRATADALRSGTVWCNTYGTFDAALPFGGFKASGIGRELGEVSLKSYLEPKTIVFG